LICVLLALVTLAAYWQVRHFEFVNYDDPAYVTANPHVFRGLTGENIAWAFTSFQASNWHPLTWLSHMLDCQLFGPRPGGHHLTNLFLHTANTLLLFGLFRKMTGAIWRSALVAAFFAWHPLHVESVAWIAERKDVLSTLFGLLTLTAYAAYAQKSAARTQGSSAETPAFDLRPLTSVAYWLTLMFFILGLMSKPMLVTLPFVMLLLDFWPLRRMQMRAVRLLILEKIPLFIFSAAGCALTLRAQNEAILDSGSLPFGARLTNAVISYAAYVRKMIWPVELAVLYPYHHNASSVVFHLAMLDVGFIWLLILRMARRSPYLLFGWLWYLGTLVPVIGLVQVGAQSLADRYTYLPLTGIFVMCIWGAADLASRFRYGTTVAGILSVILLAACLCATWGQQKYWHDSVTLFQRDLEVCPEGNPTAHHCLGRALFLKGDDAAAIPHYEEVLRLLPNLPDGYVSMGNSLNRQQKFPEAEFHYREAIRLDPTNAEAFKSLGTCLATQMKLEEARINFLMALKFKPDYAQAHTRLGTLLMLQGKAAEALEHLTTATKIYPDFDEGQYYLANALVEQKRFAEAADHFRAAIKANPDYAVAFNDLAWMLATQVERTRANMIEAISLARQACELTHGTNASHLATLGIAYSESGRFPEAVASAEKAVALARANGEVDLAAQVEKQLTQYRASRSATGRN